MTSIYSFKILCRHKLRRQFPHCEISYMKTWRIALHLSKFANRMKHIFYRKWIHFYTGKLLLFKKWTTVDLQYCINFCYTVSDSAYIYIYIYIHTYIFFHILFHYDLSQNAEHSSMYYTARSCVSSFYIHSPHLRRPNTQSFPPSWQPQACSLICESVL